MGSALGFGAGSIFSPATTLDQVRSRILYLGFTWGFFGALLGSPLPFQWSRFLICTTAGLTFGFAIGITLYLRKSSGNPANLFRFGKGDWILVSFVALMVLITLTCRLKYEHDYVAAQMALATNEDPLEFLGKALASGISKDEVKRIARGYQQLQHLPAGPINPEKDVFVFRFGFYVPGLNESYGIVSVEYDPQGRVTNEPWAEKTH